MKGRYLVVDLDRKRSSVVDHCCEKSQHALSRVITRMRQSSNYKSRGPNNATILIIQIPDSRFLPIKVGAWDWDPTVYLTHSTVHSGVTSTVQVNHTFPFFSVQDPISCPYHHLHAVLFDLRPSSYKYHVIFSVSPRIKST